MNQQPLFNYDNDLYASVEREMQTVEKRKRDNPCIVLHGYGPHGKQCKDCIHLLSLDYHNKTYHKCDLRKITHGAGSDHRVHWTACARFEQKEQEKSL